MKEEKKFNLYRASAGTGKTYTLVREFLALCLSSPNLIYSNILAVTFTNKAANEMKAKILDNLKGIMTGAGKYKSMKEALMAKTGLEEKELIDRSASLYNVIIHNYSDLNVSTIDSFVQQISRTFARELQLPSQYRISLDDDDFIDEIIQCVDKEIGPHNEELTAILKEYIEYNLKEEYGWRLDRPIKDFIEKLLKESAYKKGESFNIKALNNTECHEVIKSIDDKIEEYKKKMKESIREFYDAKLEKYCLKAVYSFIEKLENNVFVDPKSLMTDTIKQIIEGDKLWYKGKKEPSTDFDVKEFVIKLYKFHSDLYLLNMMKKNLYLFVMRGALFQIINQHIEDTNKVHISEFNKRISDIIADCSVPFIYERIGAKFAHFFIDEFQDTSILQWFNFLPLIHNSLANGNLNLLVGDAKQSIYRFRSGEVEQINKLPCIYNKPDNSTDFELYEKQFEYSFKDESLSVNYRSMRNIVYFNNSFFNYACKMLDNKDHVKIYTDSMNQAYDINKNEYYGCVNIKIYNKEDVLKKEYKEAVMERIVDDINHLKNKGFKLSDITILVRYNSEGSIIAEYLSQRGIDVISSDSITLKSSDKVQLIIHALKYMMNENDNIARLNLSYYNDLFDEETSSDNLEGTISKYHNAQVEYKRLLDLRDKALSLYDLCVGIIREYDFNIVDDVFLQYFMSVVHDRQNNENDGINEFIDFWDKKSDSLHVKISGKIDAVQIISIHKSKGLEYKVVLYPFVPAKLAEKVYSTEKWVSNDDEDFANIFGGIKHIDSFMLPISKQLYHTYYSSYYNEEVNKVAFDDINVMYVAMTRARDVLYLYTTYENNCFFPGYIESLRAENNGQWNVSFEFINENSESDFEELQYGDLVFIDEKEGDNVPEIALDENDCCNTRAWEEFLDFDNVPTVFGDEKEDDDARERGILFHEILSKIKTVGSAETIFQFYVNNGYLDQENADKWLHRFYEMAEDSRIKDAYSDKAVIRNEVEIFTKDKYKIRPDRFVELGDRAILIDYKTGAYSEEHEMQIKKYMTALEEISGNKNIEAYLVYIGEKNDIIPV